MTYEYESTGIQAEATFGDLVVLSDRQAAAESACACGTAFGQPWEVNVRCGHLPEELARQIRLRLDALEADLSGLHESLGAEPVGTGAGRSDGESGLSRDGAGFYETDSVTEFLRRTEIWTRRSGVDVVATARHPGPLAAAAHPARTDPSASDAKAIDWAASVAVGDLLQLARAYALDQVAMLTNDYPGDLLLRCGNILRAKGAWDLGSIGPDGGEPRDRMRLDGLAIASLCPPLAGDGIVATAIVAGSALAAQAAALAIPRLGEEAGLSFAARERLGALLLISDGAELRRAMTPDFIGLAL